MTFAEELMRRGFASEQEYWEMIARLPASTPPSQIEEWRDRKGTKAELEGIARGEEER